MLDSKNIFPLVRRVFPSLIANELVSVQPMTMPPNDLFFVDYIYSQPGDIFIDENYLIQDDKQ